MRHKVILFGEAEKGAYKTPHKVKELPQLMDRLGNPPPESEGLFYAVQALLYEREIVYFRVVEEGFSHPDYYFGIQYLEEKEKGIHALCLPKVGDPELLNAFQTLCQKHKSVLITTQKDLYDYLTS